MKTYWLAGLLVVSSASGAVAAPPEEKSPADKSAKICKVEETIGSRLAKRRICRTAEEWKAVAEEAKRANDEVSQRGMTSGSRFGTGG
ncbi:hypothetical protein [Altericroceibacterium xinjiangense]|uniref:hypothetical protein n=1 Tax=Altericroceibacterium xinjiangense TaxID=762261 RepID=UPI000F7F6BF4|nr:hypothetical protein [Altericroceibacterium xinjiangense]